MPSTLADDTSPETVAPEIAAAQNRPNVTAFFYSIDSIDKAETPGGGQGHDWYRYVLKNHNSTIEGFRRGSHQHVHEYAAQYAEQLNTRAMFGPASWSPRGKKLAPRAR